MHDTTNRATKQQSNALWDSYVGPTNQQVLDDIKHRLANNQTVSEHEARMLERHMQNMKAPSL